MPTPPVAPYPAPHGKTARRLEWAFLPPHLRAWIERRCGSPVVSAITQNSGFTPGFASVLVCEDGSRHFAKAASVKAQRMFADSYREEARKLAALPATVPAPRLLWHLDEDWVVLGTEYVAGRAPHRPWRRPELDALLDALEQVADALTPPPADLALDRAEDDFAPLLDGLGRHPRRPDRPRPRPPRRGGGPGPPLRRGGRRRHPRPHRHPLRQRDHRRRRSGPDLRLELAGARRRVVRLGAPPSSPRAARASTSTRSSPRDGCCATSTRRPSTSTWRSTSATSSTSASCPCRRRRRTCATTSAGRARSAGTGWPSAGAGCDRTARGRRTPGVRRRPRRRPRLGGPGAGLPRRGDRRAGGRHVARVRDARDLRRRDPGVRQGRRRRAQPGHARGCSGARSPCSATSASTSCGPGCWRRTTTAPGSRC